MIGTRIKGFRHLIQVAKSLSEIQILFKHNNLYAGNGVVLYIDGEKYKNHYMMTNGDYLMIFNDVYHNVNLKLDYYKGTELREKIITLLELYPHVWIVPVKKRSLHEDATMFYQNIMLPADFNKKYDDFCAANKKQMVNATRYANIHDAILKYIFAITNGSKNFFFWAVNAYFKQNISLYLLERIMIWNDGYSQLSNKLSKGTITGYTNIHDIFHLVSEMMALRRNKRANDMINMFNTAQKKALKGYSLTDRDYDTLSKFGKLSPKKKNNFIRKMSTINDPAEILKQMSFLADIHFEWNKNSLMEFIKNTDSFKCDIIIDKDDFVLLKVYDYDTVKRLAKTTNWCISKDRKYWKQYVEDNPKSTQYVLMDFSKKEDDNLSIVGFTSIHDRGITNAHDFQNRDMMKGRRVNRPIEIKSLLPNSIDSLNIFSVLDSYGIKMSDVVTYEPSKYEWNRESMFKYLHKFVSEEDYYIIHDDGNRVAMIIDSGDFMYFLGNSFVRNASLDTVGTQYILFADFSKDKNDPEKLLFGTIQYNSEEHESYCTRLYNDKIETINQSFDSKIEEYGLPYDIICRKNNIVERFYSAISSFELSTARHLLKEKKVIESLKNKENIGLLRDSIIAVTMGYSSLDYLNLFYDNDWQLSNIVGDKCTTDLAKRMIMRLFDNIGIIKDLGMTEVPSNDDVNSLLSKNINNPIIADYVYNFIALMKVLDNEKNRDFFFRIICYVHDRQIVNDLSDLLMTKILDSININGDFGSAKYLISYAYNFKRSRLIIAINKKEITNPNILSLIDSYSKPKITSSEVWLKDNYGTYVLSDVGATTVTTYTTN